MFKRINLYLLIAILTISFQSCSSKSQDGYYKGYELPPYKITKQIDNIEFREYQPRLVAQVEVEGERQEAAKEGFMTLAKYIFGKNIQEQKVSMTSPVVQEEVSQKISMTSPVTQIKSENQKWVVQFGMPSKYKIETLPKPKDERIKFKMTKSKKVIAITFASLWSDEKFNEEKEKLAEFIKKNNLKTKGDAIIAYYDDPFTFPWNRRNEIIWELQ